jgi:predicted  nucleic acid-binding Zn-ribbon protein
MNPRSGMAALYDRDFYAWTQQVSGLLRKGCFAEADIEHIAQEIEDIGKERQHALKSHTRRLVMHLLKWEAQPAKRTRSWRASMSEARTEIADVLEENPSLKSLTAAMPVKVYERAVMQAMDETGLPRKAFPSTCPYTFEQLMDDAFPPRK